MEKDEKITKMAEQIQKLDKQLDAEQKVSDRLKREREWLIEDFGKSLQFHSKVKTTLEFQKDIIRDTMDNALK